MKPTKGVISAGSKLTAEAGEAILKEGGNAFDAAIAAGWMTFVAEPTMTTAAGGGFMTCHTSNGKNRFFDFFTQTPRQKYPVEQLDFFPVEIDYNGATQIFHVGVASVATPGNIAGMFHIHEQFGTLPMRELIAPAVEAAKNGFIADDFFLECFELCAPAITSAPEGKELFSTDGNLPQKGNLVKFPELASTLEILGLEGKRLFYEGEIARELARYSEKKGGYLRYEDLANYQVIERSALSISYRDCQIFTNPPPSAGGSLLSYLLKILEKEPLGKYGFGSIEHLTLLSNAMRLTKVERKRRFDGNIYEPDVIEKFFNAEDLAALQRILSHMLDKIGSTTHFTVADEHMNIASITSSVGEGSGCVIPGTGIMLNNMLGEEDLNPHGFHQWKCDQRQTSMMAPTIVFKNNRAYAALGTGGANRIRSIIPQVISNLVDFGMSPQEAVQAPRVHWENNRFDAEPGFNADVIEDFFMPDETKRVIWDRLAFYFGGAHSIYFDEKGGILGIADERRKGSVRTV